VAAVPAWTTEPRVAWPRHCERAAIRRGLKHSRGEVRDLDLNASAETLTLAAESREEETSITQTGHFGAHLRRDLSGVGVGH
jgi:hypothetical protein